MLLKVKELPIINESQGIVGKLEGFNYENSKIVSIYCNIGETFFHIPINEVIIGKDAIIIKDIYAQKYLKIDNLKYVYNKYGERVGYLQYIELDEEHRIKSIVIDDITVSSEHILKIYPTIVIDLSIDELIHIWNTIEEIDYEQENIEVKSNNVEVFNIDGEVEEEVAVVIEKVINKDEMEPVIEVIEESECTKEECEEQDALNILNIEEDKCIFKSPVEVNDFDNDIISKYKYLSDKSLEESIIIDDEEFTKGYRIDRRLIEKAMSSNEIVRLIMAAEE